VDGGETVGNSLWRAPREATTGWTEETVGNSLRRDGSDDRVDGRETVGNSLVKVPWGRSEMEATTGWTGGETVGNSLGRAPW